MKKVIITGLMSMPFAIYAQMSSVPTDQNTVVENKSINIVESASSATIEKNAKVYMLDSSMPNSVDNSIQSTKTEVTIPVVSKSEGTQYSRVLHAKEKNNQPIVIHPKREGFIKYKAPPANETKFNIPPNQPKRSGWIKANMKTKE